MLDVSRAVVVKAAAAVAKLWERLADIVDRWYSRWHREWQNSRVGLTLWTTLPKGLIGVVKGYGGVKGCCFLVVLCKFSQRCVNGAA